MIRQLHRSPALRAAVAYGLGGLGWVAANLWLAAALPPLAFAYVALVLALTQISGPLGPLGLDAVARRHRLPSSPRLLRTTLATTFGVGAVTAVIGYAAYGLDGRLAGIVLAQTVAGGVTALAAAQFQNRLAFGPALALTQGQVACLLLAAIAAATAHGGVAWPPLAVYTAAGAVAAAVGWIWVRRAPDPDPPAAAPPPPPALRREAWALLVFNGAGLVLTQTDRLLIPHALTLADLATFGVLVAVVLAPFRMLQLGIAYTLQPRLRVVRAPSERRRLVWQEAVLAAVVALPAAGLVWFAAPFLVHVVLHDKYAMPPGLVLAGVIAGLLKVLEGFTTALATGVAEGAELGRLGRVSWIAVAVAAAAGFAGARYGLAGLIYGTALGWVLRSAVAVRVAAPYLRDATT